MRHSFSRGLFRPRSFNLKRKPEEAAKRQRTFALFSRRKWQDCLRSHTRISIFSSAKLMSQEFFNFDWSMVIIILETEISDAWVNNKAMRTIALRSRREETEGELFHNPNNIYNLSTRGRKKFRFQTSLTRISAIDLSTIQFNANFRGTGNDNVTILFRKKLVTGNDWLT